MGLRLKRKKVFNEKERGQTHRFDAVGTPAVSRWRFLNSEHFSEQNWTKMDIPRRKKSRGKVWCASLVKGLNLSNSLRIQYRDVRVMSPLQHQIR